MDGAWNRTRDLLTIGLAALPTELRIRVVLQLHTAKFVPRTKKIVSAPTMKWGTVACMLAVVGVVAYVLHKPRDMVLVHSSVTGKTYEVRRRPDAQQVADRLATLEKTLHAFLRSGTEAIPGDARLATIRRRWDGTLAETEAREDVAFTVDKRSISLCLRDGNGHLEDLNASMFVLLHELAHVCTQSHGHDPEFWESMKFLLELAERLGFYKYTQHTASSTYCGHSLGSSPLTCVKQQTCASLL